jgi:uncharacterized surface protein with fasciclin (FAS1) repeats
MTATRSRSRSFLLLAALAASLAAAAIAASVGSRPATAASGEQTIVNTAAQAGQFGTLLKLAKKAGLVGALSSSSPLTLFAPTDAAFKAVPKTTLDGLATNRAALRRVLLYHVVKGNVPASRIVKLKSVKTLAGPTIAIRVGDKAVFLNRTTKVLKTDISATNGTIHVINKVLLPPAK